MRTVPSDLRLLQGMVQLLKEFQWNWISIIASQNEYGEQGVFQFTSLASQNGICIAYQAFIPQNISAPNANTSIQAILIDIQKTGVNVTILFSTLPEAQAFLQVVIETQQKMVWIASATLSQALTLQQMPGLQSIGTVIGFTARSRTISGFQDYVYNILGQIEQERRLLLNASSANVNGSHKGQATKYVFKTRDLQEQCQACSMLTPENITLLQDPVILGHVYQVYTAVQFIAQAIHNVMRDPRCNLHEEASSILPWQVSTSLIDL